MTKVLMVQKKALKNLVETLTELAAKNAELSALTKEVEVLKESAKNTMEKYDMEDFQCVVDGVDWKAQFIDSTRTSLDKEALIETYGKVIETRFTKTSAVRSFRFQPLKKATK